MSDPTGNIARRIVTRAIDSQASAIQIKLEEERAAVYYHSERAIHRRMTMPAQLFPPVVTRYKMWADVDLLNRRYPLKGQFPLIHGRRHYSVDVIWEDPRHDPKVTMSIVAGAEARAEDEDEELV